MKKRFVRILAIGITSILLGCQGTSIKSIHPSDPKSTCETVNLYRHLNQMRTTGIMFGQQDALAYGIGWKASYLDFISDVNFVSGEYPAIYGWDLGHIGDSVNIDSVNFELMKHWMKEVYKKNGIITISWHHNNPVSGGTAWELTPAVERILPGGDTHQKFMDDLKQVSLFMKDLTGDKGEPIPFIFRPYHEMEGNWFWWGKPFATPEQYKELWHMTVNYLRSEGLHNVLYSYNPDFKGDSVAEKYYPGDEYVDFVGIDTYSIDDTSRIAGINEKINWMIEFANQHNLIPAISEAGCNLNAVDSDYWTRTLLPFIQGKQLSYVLFWRNANRNHYFVPYPGQYTANDFNRFIQNDYIITLSAMKSVYSE